MYLILIAVFSLTLSLTSCNQTTTSPESDEPDSRSVSELPNTASGTIAYVDVSVISMKNEKDPGSSVSHCRRWYY